MATIDEIEQIKNLALSILDQQIADGIGHKNAAASLDDRQRIDGEIHKLMARRRELHRWAVTAQLDSPELKAALDGLQKVTARMNEVAERMKATTEFIDNAADLLGATDKAIEILNKI